MRILELARKGRSNAEDVNALQVTDYSIFADGRKLVGSEGLTEEVGVERAGVEDKVVGVEVSDTVGKF